MFVYGITPFVSLRVLEQLTLDLAAMNLSVNIVSVGAGFTYSTDGPTHHGLQDLSAVCTIPNMTVLNSSDPFSTKALAKIGAIEPGPKYIRIEKGILPNLTDEGSHDYSKGFIELKKGNDLTILSTGALVHEAIKASDFLHKKEGKSVGVIDLYRLKPLPDLELIILLRGSKRIVTLEEGYLDGGMGSMIGTLIAENKLNIPFLRMGLKNEFCFVYDSREAVLDKYGLTSSKIAEKISSWIR